MPTSTQPSSAVVPVLTAVTALGSVSVSLCLPSLPAIAETLHATPAAAKFTLTAFLFTFALAQLIYGPLSDRFGRRAPILAGIGVYLAGSLACASAPAIAALVAARIVQAFGASAGPALGRAVIRDLFEGASLTSALAVVAAAVALSPMLGPFAGGVIATSFGWRAGFLSLAIAGILLALAILRWLPETSEQRDPMATRPGAVMRRYAILLADREYLCAVLCGGCLTAGNFAWSAAAPFVFAERYSIAPDRYGQLALVVGAGYVAGTLLAARLSRVLNAPRLVYSGLASALVSSMALVAVAHAGTVWPLLFCAAFYTLGMGIVIPSAAACALSRMPQMAGSAAGLLGALQILTGALGTSVVSSFSGGSVLPVACVMVVCATCAFFFGWQALFPFREQKVAVEHAHV